MVSRWSTCRLIGTLVPTQVLHYSITFELCLISDELMCVPLCPEGILVVVCSVVTQNSNSVLLDDNFLCCPTRSFVVRTVVPLNLEKVVGQISYLQNLSSCHLLVKI